MTTRRGSQHSIQSDGGGLRSRADPSKGRRKGKIPSVTESTQGSAILKRQVLDMPMISEAELELSMSNSNRDKTHAEGSNRHLYEPVKTVLHSVHEQRLGNVATNPPRSDDLLAYPEKFLKEEEIVRYSNGWNPLSSKPQIKKIKEYHAKNKEASKEEAPVACYQQASSQPNFPRREEEQEKELEGTIFPKLQDPKNLKICHGKCLQHGQNLDGIQGQRGTKDEKTSFPKELTLSPDVVNNLTEMKNSMLPFKGIKNSPLSLQEINNSLSSLSKIAVQNKNEIDNIKFMVENNKPKSLIDNT
ncbi:hypothetical protein O181_052884 [Austropuccinia psidii MF-1]|uniref:Uncharacterized protein n=1 Tax=Austropuccinia psidii MF-1 TaxID=1389203 RepID=A0A9Q3E1K6_9BASI|nr:hypothetical protein [Austropuccinia psidii MF-1]